VGISVARLALLPDSAGTGCMADEQVFAAGQVLCPSAAISLFFRNVDFYNRIS
jgi:hypothetical protein